MPIYYPISEEAARRAKLANSFRDYVSGSATAEYEALVDKAAAIAEAQKAKVDPIHHEEINGLLDAYAKKLAANLNSHYAIEARVPSIMIAGGSKFPTAKKEKQNAARDRNMQEWHDIQGYLDRIKSTGTGSGGISSDDPDAIDKLGEKLAMLEDFQVHMKAVNVYFRKHGTLDGCPQFDDEGKPNGLEVMQKPWRKAPSPYATYELTNNNANIKRVRERIDALKRLAEAPEMGDLIFDGGKIVVNKDINRLQINFDGRPDEATRESLKSNGFRWAPSEGAWQRQYTANALRATKVFLRENNLTVQRATP